MRTEDQPPRTYPPVIISDTEVRPLSSKIVAGMEYLIYIALPRGYESSPAHYPTLYFLDAWSQFGLLVQTYWVLRCSYLIPPLVLVGIAYEGDVADYNRYRSRDYLPRPVSPDRANPTATGSRGAPEFVQCFRDEFIPLVEAEYRVDPSDRTLVGDSFGGLFGAYALFNAPDLFNRYLLVSPTTWWDGWTIMKDEEHYAASNDDLPARVFLSVGSDEGAGLTESWERLRDALVGRKYPGLQLTAVKFEGESHMSVIPAAYSRGLRVLFGSQSELHRPS